MFPSLKKATCYLNAEQETIFYCAILKHLGTYQRKPAAPWALNRSRYQETVHLIVREKYQLSRSTAPASPTKITFASPSPSRTIPKLLRKVSRTLTHSFECSCSARRQLTKIARARGQSSNAGSGAIFANALWFTLISMLFSSLGQGAMAVTKTSKHEQDMKLLEDKMWQHVDNCWPKFS